VESVIVGQHEYLVFRGAWDFDIPLNYCRQRGRRVLGFFRRRGVPIVKCMAPK